VILIIKEAGRTVCTQKGLYPPDIMKSLKKNGYTVKIIEEDK
jgi:hypothetical protein